MAVTVEGREGRLFPMLSTVISGSSTCVITKIRCEPKTETIK
jgi:hypothetical protein